MKLTPLADNVLLKHMEAEEKTASGIILSTATKEKSVIAEVIAAGPGTDDVKVTVKKGDKVVTAGGIFGKICEVNDKTFVVEIAPGIKITIDKGSVYPSAAEATQDAQQNQQK